MENAKTETKEAAGHGAKEPAAGSTALEKKAEAKPADAAKKESAPATGAKKAKPEKGKRPAAEKDDKAKKREIVFERVYVFPLATAYHNPKMWHANRAIRVIRELAARHAKAAPAKVRLSTALNELVRARGTTHIPRSVKVRISKDKDGTALVEPTK